MTKQEFFRYIEYPENLTGNSLPDIENLIRTYPYFQIGRMLYLKNAHNVDSIEYDKNLSITSAYSPGGKVLYNLINKKQKLPLQKEAATLPLAPVEVTPPLAAAHQPNNHPAQEAKEEDEFDELQVLHNEMLSEAYRTSLTVQAEEPMAEDIVEGETSTADSFIDKNGEHTFCDWLKNYSQPPPVSLQENKTSPVIDTPKGAAKKDIVNKFILAEIEKQPKKSKAEFYSADVMAKRSVQDNENIVSETLASIYLKQGNLPKALRAYQILLGRHPEKVSIFAPLLEKIKKLIEEQKTK